MSGSLAGKVVLITGAGRGIGRELAVGLAAKGAAVAVNDIDAQSCDESTRAIQASGGDAIDVAGDVSVFDEASAMVGRAVAWGKRIDVLINNAAVYEETPCWTMTPDAWARMINVNLTGVFNCCRAAMDAMISRRQGSIVNLASIGAERGSLRAAHYAAAKAGVLGLTRSLCRELGPYGIRANSVSPGIVRTELNEQSVKEREANYISDIPLGRLGEPNDLLGIVAFLASDESRYVSGQTLSVNGGLHRT